MIFIQIIKRQHVRHSGSARERGRNRTWPTGNATDRNHSESATASRTVLRQPPDRSRRPDDRLPSSRTIQARPPTSEISPPAFFWAIPRGIWVRTEHTRAWFPLPAHLYFPLCAASRSFDRIPSLSMRSLYSHNIWLRLWTRSALRYLLSPNPLPAISLIAAGSCCRIRVSWIGQEESLYWIA
jgi:hypothetical protein